MDSLVIYDADEATVQAASIYTSSADAAAEDEFVDKIRRLQHKWQAEVGN